uniref:Eukaryotic translation initiation factor 3 subunit p66 n=1 Tax=Glossina brevipalpis TaxID=37001 RepID=A0A1A9W3I5_9MUSC
MIAGPNEPKYKFDEHNPFITEDEDIEVASVGYRYKKSDLGSDIVLAARCEHNGVFQTPIHQFLSIKALNQWDSKLANGSEWRQKLGTQRDELRNNACKLAKLTVQAVLAGSEQLKLGYVSRINSRDPSRS